MLFFRVRLGEVQNEYLAVIMTIHIERYGSVMSCDLPLKCIGNCFKLPFNVRVWYAQILRCFSEISTKFRLLGREVD